MVPMSSLQAGFTVVWKNILLITNVHNYVQAQFNLRFIRSYQQVISDGKLCGHDDRVRALIPVPVIHIRVPLSQEEHREPVLLQS